jgi:DNA-binding MarR family transcriptional regulator
MNAIFFGLKRAYHGTLRVYRRALARLGLTAARFDLLYVAHEFKRHGVRQSTLRRELGVTAPTVSRMVASLEALGLVRRERSPGDRRQRFVILTKAGRRSIQRAIAVFVRSGRVQLAVDTALCPDRWYDDEECFLAMDACERILRRLRHAYRDFAKLYYRWHPDD